MAKENRVIRFDMPRFDALVKPQGWLDADIACHALWYYYTLARLNYEECEKDVIVLEGDPDPQFDNFQLFKSISMIYGTSPERMLKFWPNVRMQATALNLPALPKKYMYDGIAEIKTQ